MKFEFVSILLQHTNEESKLSTSPGVVSRTRRLLAIDQTDDCLLLIGHFSIIKSQSRRGTSSNLLVSIRPTITNHKHVQLITI